MLDFEPNPKQEDFAIEFSKNIHFVSRKSVKRFLAFHIFIFFRIFRSSASQDKTMPWHGIADNSDKVRFIDQKPYQTLKSELNLDEIDKNCTILTFIKLDGGWSDFKVALDEDFSSSLSISIFVDCMKIPLFSDDRLTSLRRLRGFGFDWCTFYSALKCSQIRSKLEINESIDWKHFSVTLTLIIAQNRYEKEIILGIRSAAK